MVAQMAAVDVALPLRRSLQTRDLGGVNIIARLARRLPRWAQHRAPHPAHDEVTASPELRVKLKLRMCGAQRIGQSWSSCAV